MTDVEKAVARLNDAQRALGQTPRTDSVARAAAMRVVEDAQAALREVKEAVKQENARRNFAGIGSPLHEAVVTRFSDDIVQELEDDAIRRQRDNESRAAARRAEKKATQTPGTPTPKPLSPPAQKQERKKASPRKLERERRNIEDRVAFWSKLLDLPRDAAKLVIDSRLAVARAELEHLASGYVMPRAERMRMHKTVLDPNKSGRA